MIKYSIILRAYNAADYVSKSIESIIQQTYKNWELIIVDDGSTDETGTICENYASKDDRIVVVRQNNKGCLLATQTGVTHATGKYVCLIDSDDWYEAEYIEKVDNIICNHNVDMVVVGYNIVNANNEKKEFVLVEKKCIADTAGAIEIFLKTTNYALWNKFVAKDKIKYTESEQNFYNTNGKTTNFGDDLYLLMPVLCGCEKIYFLPECLYNYTIGAESISHKKNNDYWNELYTRNRLMQFTYESIKERNYMSNTIYKLIQRDTLAILMSQIIGITKYKQFYRKNFRELSQNIFFKNIIMSMSIFEVAKIVGKKRTLAYVIFNILCKLY